MRILHAISRAVDRFLGSVLMTMAILVLIGGGAFLIALYGAGHFKETEGMIALRCLFEPEYPKCPDRLAELAMLQAQLAALQAEAEKVRQERDKIQDRMAGLVAMESAVDTFTLFSNHRDAEAGLSIVVGTRYKTLVTGVPKPEGHFCYVRLQDGAAGEERTLSFHGFSGPVKISTDKLARAEVPPATLAYGRLVCKPLLIGQTG